jgi:hypothetical protein
MRAAQKARGFGFGVYLDPNDTLEAAGLSE